MFSTGRIVRAVLTIVFVLLAQLASPDSVRAQAADASIFRVFLADGDTLVSYGEFARVSDRVVLCVPIGETPETLKLQMISIPANTVDWPRTEEYAHAVRAKHYADTRGEDDYTLLAARVTSALNDIHLAPDPKRRAAMAQEARGNLAAWPAANYGYRAADVAELVEMLDGVVAEMRAQAGETNFDLSLAATTGLPPPPVALLPPPNAQTALEAGFRAAVLAAEPTERIALLEALAQELSAASRTEAWAAGLRTRVNGTLAAERKIESGYAELTRTAVRDAGARAERGDVRGLQQVIARALSTDERLGFRRPDAMTALLATLDLRLDEAKRLRVVQEAWAARADVFRAYQRAVDGPRRRLNSFRGRLEQIRARRNVSARNLERLEIQATMALQDLQRVEPPPELQAAHGLYVSAFHMTRTAASLRRNALSSKHNTTLAWDASSAAAGALMLAERAAGEVNRLISASSNASR